MSEIIDFGSHWDRRILDFGHQMKNDSHVLLDGFIIKKENGFFLIWKGGLTGKGKIVAQAVSDLYHAVELTKKYAPEFEGILNVYLNKLEHNKTVNEMFEEVI